MRKVYIGVDCGATNLRVGIVDEKGQLLSSIKRSSPLKTQPNNFAKLVKEEVDKMMDKEWELEGIGVGTPGPLDLEKGLLLSSSNLQNTNPINLKDQFEQVFSSKVMFDRDTNLALLGEAWKGAAVGRQDVVMLTLGTGVGGALLINGEIERGVSGKAGEIGHMMLAGPVARQPHDLPVCGLGHESCFEAMVNSVSNITELATYLGYGLANIVDIFNPEMVVIGGGKLNWGDFLPQAVKVMRSKGIKDAVDEVEVVYARLGEMSGVYGGAKLVVQQGLGPRT